VASQSGASPDFRTGVTAVLVEKSKDTPAWSPARLDAIDDEHLIKRFFSPESPHLRTKPTLKAPAPPAAPAAQPAHAHARTARFALPSEEEIGALVRGAHASSGGVALTLDELVLRAQGAANGKHGVAEKVREVAARRTTTERGPDGREYLVWKH
jgi:3-hydroxyisobutyryl-CoA hydrolase